MFQVLKRWSDKKIPTTRDLVDRVQGWWTRGFIEPQVWDSIMERVAFQLPEKKLEYPLVNPTYLQSEQQGPPDEFAMGEKEDTDPTPVHRRMIRLKHLLGDKDLKYLDERNLRAVDLQDLAEAVKCGRLPQLKELGLDENPLTDCLKHLLGDPDVKFTSLERLDLRRTCLSAADLQVLAEAVKCGRLPQLKKLELWSNTLTDCLKHLLGDPDVKFTSLEEMNLDRTHLSAADLQVLAEAVKCGRLPKLAKSTWMKALCKTHLWRRKYSPFYIIMSTAVIYGVTLCNTSDVAPMLCWELINASIKTPVFV